MDTPKFSTAKPALFLLLLSAGISCGEDDVAAPQEEINVALYSGRGADADCITAAEKMFEWMGYEVERISSSRINTASLDKYDLISFPGGDMYSYSRDISATGKQKIRRFISGGGAYIGICGGAFFAAEEVHWRGSKIDMTPLSLYEGLASGPINAIYPYPEYGMTQLDIADAGHPIADGEPDSITVLYYWGPYLAPDPGFDFETICSYHENGLPAMIAFDYGSGRVFLTGAHPEFEEDSDRDGTDFCDHFDDKGSDWNFMRKAARWCLCRI